MLRLPFRRLQLQCPLGIRRVVHEMAIEVRRPVAPPDWSSLTKGNLRGIDDGAGGVQIAMSAPSLFDGPESIHQFGDKLVTPDFR